MNKKLLSLLNLFATLGLIFWNYFANSGTFDGKTIGDISDKYNSLFTPASYAFAIWGIIFLGLLSQSFYLIYLAFKNIDEENVVGKISTHLVLVNILNSVWVYLWLQELILPSVITMILLFVVLLKLVFALRMEVWDAPLKTIVLIWWPIDLYVGWIAVALVANVSSYLNFLDFSLGLEDTTWVIIMIGVVALINYLMVQQLLFLALLVR